MSGTSHSGQCALNVSRGIAGLANVWAKSEGRIRIDDALDLKLVKGSSIADGWTSLTFLAQAASPAP